MAKLGKGIKSGSEELATLQRWWHYNGKYAATGLVLVIGGVGGWTGWDYYRDQHVIDAAERYMAFVERLESDDVGEVGGEISELPIEKYNDTVYLPFAYLRRAKYFVEQDEFEKSAKDLRWVAENSVQPALSELAYIRLIRNLIVLRKTEEALQILDEVDFSNANTVLVENARGDVLLATNDVEGAIAAYRAGFEGSPRKPDFLRMKLEMLGQNFMPPPDQSGTAQ